jgi:4-amino-4-deoxy-L-arabinose transferase-like glycosyltransferase
MTLALAFLAAALAARAPGLLFLELNWDEALYWRIAGEAAHGHLPLAGTWDRKPPGLFLVLAAPRALFGESIAVLRLATSLGVALAALALHAIARDLLPGPRGRAAGLVAGLAYIGFSVRVGGEGTNAELVLAPFALAGMALALRAARRQRPGLALAAGALLGVAVLIKQVALFDGLAAALMLLASPAGARLRCLAAMAIGAVLPALAILALYAAAGEAALLRDNLLAAGGAGGAAFNWPGLWTGIGQIRPLLAGAALGLLALLAARAWRPAFALLAWAASIAAVLLLLGRFGDHMFLQALPPLALGTGALVALAAARLPPRLAPELAAPALAGLALLALGALPFLLAGAETVPRRAAGTPHWGDRTATLAAALAPRIAGPDDLLVMGRTLALYPATATRPPTRFAFIGHIWEPYAPLPDGMAELERILAASPRFVVVDDNWLPGGHRHTPRQAAILDRLAAWLAEAGYIRDGQVGRFTSRGGGFIGGGVGATVFRRPDTPPPPHPPP